MSGSAESATDASRGSSALSRKPPALVYHNRQLPMARILIQPRSQIQHSIAVFKHWSPSAATWGIGAGTAALLFLSVTPLVKREVLVKIPVLGSYYEDKTPASDLPF